MFLQYFSTKILISKLNWNAKIFYIFCYQITCFITYTPVFLRNSLNIMEKKYKRYEISLFGVWHNEKFTGQCSKVTALNIHKFNSCTQKNYTIKIHISNLSIEEWTKSIEE